MIRSRRWLVPAFILLLALVLRLAGAAWWQARLPMEQKFYFGDSASYWDLAGDIAAGRAYEYQGSQIFRTPGYPIVLAPMFVLWRGEPPILVVRAWNALMGAAAVGGVMLLARFHFDDRVANVAGLLAAVLPEAIAGSVFVLSEAAFVPLMIAQLILSSRAPPAKTFRSSALFAVAGGVCGGMAVLVRPSWLLFTPLLGIVHAFTAKSEASVARRIGVAALPMLGVVLMTCPWWIRNYNISGYYVPTSTEVGSSLYDGLNPRADGSSNMDFKPALEAQFAALDVATLNDRPAAREVRLDQFFRLQASTWAGENPGRVLELAGVKFLRMWNFFPNASDFRSNAGRWLIAFTYGPVLLLAVVGACLLVRRTPIPTNVLTLTLPAIYLTLLHLIFVSSLRYRLPALLPLLILSAVASVWIYEQFVPKRIT